MGRNGRLTKGLVAGWRNSLYLDSLRCLHITFLLTPTLPARRLARVATGAAGVAETVDLSGVSDPGDGAEKESQEVGMMKMEDDRTRDEIVFCDLATYTSTAWDKYQNLTNIFFRKAPYCGKYIPQLATKTLIIISIIFCNTAIITMNIYRYISS